MKKIILISVCLAVFIYSNTAFAESACAQLGVDCQPQGGSGYSCDEACQQERAERAEARAEAAAERARERAAYNKALNEAYQQAESSRKDAERSAVLAQSKTRELAQLRNSMIDPAKVDEANRRYRDAVMNKEKLTNQLDSLQKKISQRDASFDTAVYLNEEALRKTIMIKPSVSTYKQAQKYLQAQQKELNELEEQSRYLSTFSLKSEERIRVEKQIQSKAIFGLGLDLLDLAAPVFADKELKLAYKVAYATTKSAVALGYTVTAPDSAELTKKANVSVNNLVRLAALNPTWANDPQIMVAVQGMAIMLKIQNFAIEHDSPQKTTVLPPELRNEYIEYLKLGLNIGGVFYPPSSAAHALVSLNERADQYIHAEDSIKQIRRMKEAGFNAKEYIDDRILTVDRNLEASKQTIKAYELGDRK